MTIQPELDIHDMVRELTTTHTHREEYLQDRGGKQNAWQAAHFTNVPALILQLVESTDTTAGDGSEGGTTPRSKPAARIEAMDVVWLINTEASEWITRLGESIPDDSLHPITRQPLVGTGTIRRLQRLNGLYPGLATCGRDTHPKPRRGGKDDDGNWVAGRPWCCPRGRLESDVKGWWLQARIVSGWDIPAFRPRASCPVCEKVGGLRVKLEGASCTKCQSIWGASEVPLLAEHIRHEQAGEALTDAS